MARSILVMPLSIPCLDVDMADKLDLQGIAQPINLDGVNKSTEKLPVYDDPDTGTSLRDAHIWSFDTTLAQILDEGLTRILNFPYQYVDPNMARVRDVFRAYANRFTAEDTGASFEYVDTDDYQELMWALEWVKENFTGLWT